ncbi:MAG: major capsid protein [Pseudonocardia sp.]|nr:major capsid protein [Pseudonocardia sp.]
MPFQLPAELPATVEELTALRDAATAEIADIQARFDANDDLTPEDVTALNTLLDSVGTLDSAITEASTEETAHKTKVDEAMARARAATTAPEAPAATETEAVEAEVVEEPAEELAPAVVADGGSGGTAVPPTAQHKPDFRGLGTQDAPDEDRGPRWVVAAGAPGFAADMVGKRVGFAEIGKALDSVRGSGVGRATAKLVGPKMRQEIARMVRGVPEVTDEFALVAAINEATDERKLPGGSLTAAGGWCAPSEQLYDFCDVPNATDLVSVPEITINRGGIRWPVEPDMTSIFENFEFFFTEPELQAVDGSGNPTAIKHQIEIPCPDEFEELRLNAVGWSVTAGILQRQGWPESIAWFLQTLTQEHFRAMSRRSIRDIVNGSDLKTIDPATTFGSVGPVLNSLALMATNIRLHRGLARTTTIEGIAPSWLLEVLRADLAYRGDDDLDHYNVTDAQIMAWLNARNIALQFVGDWQTRDASQPGNLNTLRWPGHVDVALYPAGTWFRAMSNIIEVGALYPREQLVINRYTEFFTEDAIAVGKRCGVSIVARIPLKVDGAVSARQSISYTDTSDSFGGPFDGTPIPSGQEDTSTTTVLAVTGGPSGGYFTAGVDGSESGHIAVNAAPADVVAALAAAAASLGEDDFTVTGSVGGPWTVSAKSGIGKLTIVNKSFIGGTAPNATAT